MAGCLPSSCRRGESRELFPADSLSRQLAAETPVDTLRQAWAATGTEGDRFGYPRTVQFGPRGRLYVSDADRDRVWVLDAEGTVAEVIASETFDTPYLAGFRGDTLAVFSPEAQRLDFVVGGSVARTVLTPRDLPERGRLHYAAVTDAAVYYKLLAQDFDGYLARLRADGTAAEQIRLDGPYWQYAGLLKPWEGRLLSLSGYRPEVDVFGPDGLRDTLRLAGFDSPMLARRRAFLLGETHEAPLLTASAAPAGDYLFVLNMRPGWLQIDVYDPEGQLRRILLQPDPTIQRAFFPVDLAARRAEGGYELAVAYAQPEPKVVLFVWEGSNV